MDRRNRNSNDSQRPRQSSNPNVFADDYALDPDEDDFMPAISDGFRPSNPGDAWHGDRQDHDRNDPSQSQFTPPKLPDNDLRRMATRNSTTKALEFIPASGSSDGRPPGMQNSPLPHHRHQASSSQSTPLQHRESISSTASFATMTRSESPFATGPSHPYGMYPQLTAARSASISTTSTQRQPNRSSSLHRPTHPYAMYSQSGIDGIDDDQPEERPAVPQISIPVGFPGLNMGYHRVIGPDGEEQDIIGPDGHTEQLPPYSRYPEEGPTKASLAAEASASRIVPVSEPVAHPDDPFQTPVSPVSPLSTPLLAVTPARLPPQRPETQTGNAASSTSYSSSAYTSSVPAPESDSASASLLATEQGASEKAEPVKTKTDWRKKKLWGRIPMGVAVMLLVLVLIFAIVLGAAIGTFVGKKDKNKDKHDGDHGREDALPQVTGPTHTLFGATPISTPPGLSPLPTGAFALPLGIPQENNPGCLTQANQYSAWSCRMTFAPLVLTINDTQTGPDGSPRQMASIEGNKRGPDTGIQYGPQPPALVFQPMQLVLDLDYKAFGPAYHFSTRYDKVVVLRQDEFGAGASLRKKKREDNPPPPNFRQRFQVMPGDLPWFCVWNQTYIEGYIYVQDNSTAGAYLNPSPTTFPPGVTPPSSQTDSVAAAQVPTTASSSGSSSVNVPQPTSLSLARRADPDPGQRTPPYPRIVKVEERRLPGSPQPYCQKMLLLDNGQIAPALNNNENAVRIYLQEDDPTLEEYFQMQPTSSSVSTSVRKRSDLEKRVDPSTACHCQWMFK